MRSRAMTSASFCACNSKVERRCGTCDKLMQAGQPLDNGECNTCAKFRRKKGRARIATSRLALDQGTEEPR